MSDHAAAIYELRLRAEVGRRLAGELGVNHRRHEGLLDVAAMNAAAADLLECHDATGISLDDWSGPRDLVNRCLTRIALPPVHPNGV